MVNECQVFTPTVKQSAGKRTAEQWAGHNNLSIKKKSIEALPHEGTSSKNVLLVNCSTFSSYYDRLTC